MEGSPGKTFYRNVGKTQKEGIEMSLSARVGKNVTIDLGYTYSQFKFANFVKNTTNLKGNKQPGIPQNILNSNIYYLNPNGYFMIAEFIRYGTIYLNDLNDQETNSYSILNLRVGNEYKIFATRFKVHVGLNNVLNTNYFSNLRINAWGGRFYEPAPPSSVHLVTEIIF